MLFSMLLIIRRRQQNEMRMKTVASDQLYLEISREFLAESFAFDWLCDNDNVDKPKAEREKISKDKWHRLGHDSFQATSKLRTCKYE